MATLAELDDLYKTTICKLPTADRISYCNQRLDKGQYILQKNITVLDKFQKEQLRKMIKAAQDEIKQIENFLSK